MPPSSMAIGPERVLHSSTPYSSTPYSWRDYISHVHVCMQCMLLACLND